MLFRSIRSLLRCAQTSRSWRSLVSAELRRRFAHILRRFFGDRSADFLHVLSVHGAIISGSTALAFLSSPDRWCPGDMDVYVGCDNYRQFLQALHDYRLAAFASDTGSRGSSSSGGISAVRRYTTPTCERLDVIQSITPNPVHPLLYFWGSLVVNFLTPRGAVCAYPSHTLNHKAFATDISYSPKLLAAREKYESRGFEFHTVDSWRPARLNAPEGSRVFAVGPILYADFQSKWLTNSAPLPIVHAGKNWVLSPDLPS